MTKTRLTEAAVNIQARALGEALNGGTFDIMTGDRPEDDARVADDFRLASCQLAAPAFAPPRDGVIKANMIAKGIAVRTGEPTWFRLRDRNGETLIEGGGSEMGLKVNIFVEGQTVSIVEYSHRVVREG